MYPPAIESDYQRLLDLVANCDPEADAILAGLSAKEAAKVIREAYAKAGKLDTLREFVEYLTRH
jgi:hypothetical protein